MPRTMLAFAFAATLVTFGLLTPPTAVPLAAEEPEAFCDLCCPTTHPDIDCWAEGHWHLFRCNECK